MRKIIILSVAILFLAGCKTAGLLGLKEMPVTQQVVAQEEAVRKMEVMPVSQVVEEMEEREKLYSLSAKDMELRKILFLFAEELSEYNLVIDPDVTGKVTVDFKELSLDKTMTILLEPLGLEHTIEDDILRISKPRMVVRSFEFVYSTTKRSASTSLVAMTGGGGETGGGEGSGNSSTSFGSVTTEEIIDVWGELEAGVRDLISEEAKVAISKRIGRVTVTDYRKNMKEVTSFMDVFKEETKKQILITAKILEVTLTEGSAFGISWEAVFRGIDLLGRTENPGTLAQRFAPVISKGLGFTGDSDAITATINRGDFEAVINALQEQGEVTVISSPQVSTLNGQKAIIRSVTEDVVFQSSQSGTGGVSAISSTTAEPFTYGVFLDVTPHVDSEGMITMDIHPSVSNFVRTAISADGRASKPIIDTRETETVATIKDGETVLIAGLMADAVSKSVTKFPFLGDIPLIKKLFRKEVEESAKKELVILINPSIVGARAKDFGDVRAKYTMLSKLFPR
ncbi:MAG: type II secretion system protein GspD [Candidatus Scalindua sp.]